MCAPLPLLLCALPLCAPPLLSVPGSQLLTHACVSAAAECVVVVALRHAAPLSAEGELVRMW